MGYKIEQVAGLDTHDAERLIRAGITTTDALLARCRTPQDRHRVAALTGLDAGRLADWYRQADLMRVSGIGAEYGRLLEHAGIENVRMLATRTPANVVNLLHRVNDMRRLTRSLPSMNVVTKWIQRARTMEQLPPLGGATPAADRTAGHGTAPTDGRAAAHAADRAPETDQPRIAATTSTPRPAHTTPPFVPRHRPMSATPVATGTGSRPGYPVAPAKPVW